ncbi:MAG: VOC family protein [Promicromonosporaceae bacterium]|nr:VOC family protein [Promicromonosporaceae bacterium]
MMIEMFFNFNGNCREALNFYSQVFQAPVTGLMTYGETPPDSGFQPTAADKELIMYAGIPVGNMTIMFMDNPSTDSAVKAGTNISPTISADNTEEVTRLFTELAKGGQVGMPLGKTFFSDWYGMVTDKFGITWQILLYIPAAATTQV